MTTKIANYLRERLTDNFKGWTQEAVEDYVMFHVEHDCLVACVDEKDSVCCVLIGWPTEKAEVPKFNWEPPTDSPRFWYWDQLAAEDPELVMIGLAALMQKRMDCVLLPSFGVRHGRVRKFRPALDLYKTGERIYGNER